MSPVSHERKVELVKSFILPLLATIQPHADEFEPSERDLDRIHTLLAEIYLEQGPHAVLQFIRLISFLLLTDIFFGLPLQAYGLVVILYAVSFLSGMSSFKDPSIIARKASVVNQQDAIDGEIHVPTAKDLAYSTVFVNIGIVFFMVGILIQVIAVIWYPGQELVAWEHTKLWQMDVSVPNLSK